MWTSLVIALAGFISGIMASVLGIGGTVLTTPVIRALGATPIHAVGSTVPAILPGALSGSIRYQREGLIVWRVALICGGTGMVFAVLGGWIADIVDAKWLMVATALLVMWCGLTLFRDARRRPVDVTELIDEPVVRGADVVVRGGVAAMVALGIGGGFLAGLLGIGGGLILTPGFSLGLKLPVKNTIATALAAVAMMSTTALVTHIALDHIDWRFALPLTIGIVPGARVGANFTIGTSEHTMRLISGVMLSVLAAIYLVTELASW